MDAYGEFAGVYDIFMDEVPYRQWCDQICKWIDIYGISERLTDNRPVMTDRRKEELSEADKLRSERNLILDLGCGTGTLTLMLAKCGYDMIGVDSAPEMLQAAMNKSSEAGREILYLCQDMRELELYSTVGCILCICDCLNYLLSAEDIIRTFRQVNNYLYPGGLFIFDFNTVYKYETVIGDSTIAENREECSFIWENYYHPAEQINEYDITVFVKEQSGPADQGNIDGGRFRRFSETHYQRGYTLAQMQQYLEQAGLTFVAAYDGDTFGAYTNESDTARDDGEKSERIFVIARENGKNR